MPRRARMIVAGAVAAIALAGMIALVVRRRHDSSHASTSVRLAPSAAAAAPFSAFRESRVAIGDQCLRVLLASTLAQRVQGLRDTRDLGPYAGMLFVFPEDSSAQFTMAQTPLPLDIGWYAASGAPVGRARMTPCPRGTDASCPTYSANESYRYALETRAGSLGSGALAGCAG